MREIKFRAWTGVEMTNAFDPKASDPDLIPAGESMVWMQFTGLLDKNGKEIYEGDVIRCYHKESEKTPREYRNMEAFRFEVDMEGGGCFTKAGDPDSQWEIIGNIYENSDLLV